METNYIKLIKRFNGFYVSDVGRNNTVWFATHKVEHFV